jgi:Zn-dependent protease
MWDKLPVKPGGGGVWDRLGSELDESASTEAGLGIWAQVSGTPGGLWSDARDETVRLVDAEEDQESIWQAAADETVILERKGIQSVWEAAQQQADDILILAGQQPDLWQELEDETMILAPGEAPGWEIPKIRDVSHYRPMRAAGWALKKLETTKGEEYYVLKNLRKGTYLRLNEQQVYVWNLMDGSYTVEDLAVALFMKYQSFAIEWLVEWLGQLRASDFLVAGEVDIYQAAGQQLWQRTLGYWGRRLFDILFRSELSFKGVDSFYGALYKLIGWFLYSRPVQILLLLVFLAGLPAFYIITPQGDLSYIIRAGGSVELGLVGLLVAQTIVLFVHESGHALTTKHYGRSLRGGGVGLYFGMPTFFMDTTDIWMEPRGPRLAVTWGGPYTGFILGSVASLALLLVSPEAPIFASLYQFAAVSYFISFVNLNPLLKLDGYYLLMDWLEIPRLRERSIAFVRKELLPKLTRREKFNREERIFTIFGVLALSWTVFFVFVTARLYGRGILNLVRNLVSG